jgi:ComF family protein
LREVIQRFKYGRKISLGKSLGRLTARAAEELFVGQKKIDLIVPVPLHARRLRWRGFNQALVLAREVGRVRGLPVDPFILRRSRPTPPQTQLAEEERRKNVRGAFTLRSEEAVADRVVLLVDDIYTSGATANECSRVLLRGGAEEVRVLTLARTI